MKKPKKHKKKLHASNIIHIHISREETKKNKPEHHRPTTHIRFENPIFSYNGSKTELG